MITGTSPHRAVALPILSVALLGLAAAGNGETIVFGGGPGSRAWDQEYSEIAVIDFEANPGSIQPLQNDPEDNISLKLIERGGQITSPNARTVLEVTQSEFEDLLDNMVDGRNTAFEIKIPSATGIILRFDLGQRFGVNRIRFFPREGFEEFFLKGYLVRLNDGSEEQQTISGNPDLRLFKTVERNLDPVVDLAVPLQFVRFIEVKQLVRGEWEIDEFEIFGEGFTSAAAYISNVFDEDRSAVFGGITWAKETIGEPAKVSATVSTRSGHTPDPSDSLKWSGWSLPYPAGVWTPIASPAPRQYWQFRVLFQSSDILSAATVDSIAVEVSPALADSVVGEVWPQDAVIGQATELTYWVRSYNSSGFDQLDIKTQAPVEVIRSVQIDGTDVAWDKEDTEDDDGNIVGVRISFPRITGDDRLLRVVFESIALHYNTVFIGRIFDTQRPQNLPQTLVPGDVDADPVAEGDDLSVTTRVADNRIYFLEAAPAPFTPNGDGVNDQTIVTYDIVNLTGGTPVSVQVYDLAGRLRRVIYSDLDIGGRYQRVWDGADDNGQMLAPGVYLVRVEVAADTGKESKTAIAPLVY